MRTIGGEDVAIESCTHQADLELWLARTGALFPSSQEEHAQCEQQEVILDGSLVHLIDEHVRHVGEAGILLEHPQEHTRRAEEQRRRPRALAALATHRVADGALAHALTALRRHAVRHTNGRDAPRLGANDIDRLARLCGSLQQELRHLRGLAGASLALDDAHVRREHTQNLVAVPGHRQRRTGVGLGPTALDNCWRPRHVPLRCPPDAQRGRARAAASSAVVAHPTIGVAPAHRRLPPCTQRLLLSAQLVDTQACALLGLFGDADLADGWEPRSELRRGALVPHIWPRLWVHRCKRAVRRLRLKWQWQALVKCLLVCAKLWAHQLRNETKSIGSEPCIAVAPSILLVGRAMQVVEEACFG